MPRRTATLLASTLLLIGLVCAGLLVRAPYAEMSPGPTFNTLGQVDGEDVLSFPGKDVSDSEASGHLNMTTVRVTGADYRMNVVEALYGWLSHDNAVVPYATVYPPGITAEQSEQENAEEFSASQESAKVAALRELGETVPTRVIVQSVVKGGPSQGTLHAGDVITAVDGEAVTEPEQVAERVTARDPGEKVSFRVVPADAAAKAEKDGKDPRDLPTTTESVATEKAPEDGRAIVGIQPGVAHTFPFPVDIKLADVGGPSAGLMFSLGIIDKLDDTDLTGGAFVAGTGTIDDAGKVGPIGGITMKTIAARDKGAEYFLTPAANCASAAADIPDGLTLVKVGDLDDALTALKDIRDGDGDDLKTCRPAR